MDLGIQTIEPSPESFQEDFNDGNADGWTSYGGTWSVDSGEYLQGDGSAYGPKSVADGTGFADFIFEADVKVLSGSHSSGNAGVIFRVTEPSTGADAYKGYYAGLRPGNDRIEVGRVNNGWTLLAEPSVSLDYDTVYRLKIDAQGGTFKIFLDGSLVTTVNDSAYTSGALGVRSHRAAARFDNIEVNPQ